MSRFISFLTVLTCIILLIDTYGYFGIRQLTVNLPDFWRKLCRWAWWVPTFITLIMFVYMASTFEEDLQVRNYKLMYLVTGFSFLFFITKAVFLGFHFADDIVHIFRWLFYRIKPAASSDPAERMTRVQFFNQVGLGASALAFGAMLYGITRGKYAFRVVSEKVSFSDLPHAFKGFRIVQISDAHLGSFLDNSFEEVQGAIQMINDLQPDVIVFTGDLVNNYATEAEPWIPYFQQLKAKYGKFSILGNHDYADYVYDRDIPEQERMRADNLKRLKDIQKEMGFQLLLNEHVKIKKDNQYIVLAGVENWGRNRFSKYGVLSKALEGVDPNDFKVLLSHDPTHWEDHVMGKEPVHITFSGHTHGAQFGVESPMLNIKVSPSPYFGYKRWAGLYRENNQYLYVNRGFGFLGFPGRVGMPPEITLVELEQLG
jgi:uncharacterized protein